MKTDPKVAAEKKLRWQHVTTIGLLFLSVATPAYMLDHSAEEWMALHRYSNGAYVILLWILTVYRFVIWDGEKK